jgi:hypothetical protein
VSMNKFILFSFSLFFGQLLFSQTPAQDTIYLMNGHVVGEKVVDTILGAVTIMDPKKPTKKIHFELDQLYLVRFANGDKRYYYSQDTLIGNWFTREEMWMYMKGENDARKGFKARGALIGAGIAGVLGGMTGSFFGPIAPYGYMALSGIPRVKIKHKTISNPNYIESDAYILGYERVARRKRKITSVIAGTAGLVVGYVMYSLLYNYYPSNVDIGINR